ncbi:MAG: outer membrane protein assembly factor BamE [Alphaproteobacteria bacterium]
MIKFSLFFLALLSLTACSPTLNTRGNFIDLENLKKIKVGETSRGEVHEILGPPSSQELFTGKGWYYIGEQNTTRSFLAPKLLERHIVFIEFDKANMVTSIKQLDQQGYDVSVSSDKTPTYGKDPSALSEIFGNMGRYNDSKKKQSQ